MPTLGVNIDHIATIRQARRTVEPDPVAAAMLAELGEQMELQYISGKTDGIFKTEMCACCGRQYERI